MTLLTANIANATMMTFVGSCGVGDSCIGTVYGTIDFNGNLPTTSGDILTITAADVNSFSITLVEYPPGPFDPEPRPFGLSGPILGGPWEVTNLDGTLWWDTTSFRQDGGITYAGVTIYGHGTNVFPGAVAYPAGSAIDGFWTVVQPVPIPAAAWLFLSGLVGLFGVGRYRTAKG